MDAVSISQDKDLDLEYRVTQLRKIREKLEEFKTEYENKIEKWELAKKQLEGALMKWLLDHKIKTTNTAAGNITWVDNTTYPIVDKVAFRAFVIDGQEWDMLDWKANKTVVSDYAEAHKGEIPPGLKPNPHPHLRVSGPGKKKTSVTKKGFDEDTPEEE